MERIKFLTSYEVDDILRKNRISYIAAYSFSKYVVSLANESGYYVDIVSLAKTKEITGLYKEFEKKEENNSILFSSCLGSRSNAIKTLYLNIWLLKYLLCNTKRREKIIVYHSINQIPALLIAKRIKKLEYILYVGEIYHNIKKHSRYKVIFENLILSRADRYIFSSNTLCSNINKENKPYIVISGIFTCVKNFNIKNIDNKIHIVYAGIINSKKGAFTACELSKYLSSKYVIHIIGHGTEKSIDELKRYIDEIKKESKCIVSYEGLMHGESYYRFLQKCQIGLCPQITSSNYNNSSFPSKISVYLANGLRVLVPYTSSFLKNVLGEKLYYYRNDSVAEIAKIISQIDLHDNYNSRDIIAKCHNDAKNALNRLFADA